MKLKLVVASMSVLGLVSCPLFAATDAKATTKHHYKKHRYVAHEPAQDVVHADYKGIGAETCQAPVECCTLSQPSLMLIEMTQNIGRSLANPCNPGWFNRVAVSGGINVDLGKWGSRDMNYMGENYQRFSLNDVYLNISAVVNDWVQAFASISYDTATTNGFFFDDLDTFDDTLMFPAEYSSAYSDNVRGDFHRALHLEQAYITVANFDCSPFFLQVGKQFQDFSRYEIHPITRSLTQVISETLATSVKLGFIASGFNGAIFAFDDPIPKFGHTSTTTNYGASLGFEMPGDQLGWGVGVAYLYNLIGVNDVAYNVQNFSSLSAFGSGYNRRVSGLAAYIDVNSGPFYIGARYTTALQRFNPLDLPEDGVADLVIAPGPFFDTATVAVDASGAKPWAAGVQANLAFDAWLCKNQNIYVGWQTSREAAGINLPRNRWLAGYNVEVWRNATLGVEWDHDSDYDRRDGGTGDDTNLVSLRAAVKFG